MTVVPPKVASSRPPLAGTLLLLVLAACAVSTQAAYSAGEGAHNRQGRLLLQRGVTYEYIAEWNTTDSWAWGVAAAGNAVYAAVMATGQMATIPGPSPGRIKEYNPTTGQLRRSFNPKEPYVDESIGSVATAIVGGKAYVYAAELGAARVTAWNAATGAAVKGMDIAMPNDKPYCAVPDGPRGILWATSLDQYVRKYNLTSRALISATAIDHGMGMGAGCAVDAAGNLYLSLRDFASTKAAVAKYDGRTGKLAWRTNKPRFGRPYGLTVDLANGRVLVADSGNNRVVVLRSDNGAQLVAFGMKAATSGPAAGRGRLDNPSGVAVLGDRLFVSEFNLGRIQVFSTRPCYRTDNKCSACSAGNICTACIKGWKLGSGNKCVPGRR